MDDAVPDLDRHRFQALAETGPAQAFTIGNAELGAVCGADDKTAVGGEEAVGHPFQWCADMRAFVDVDVDCVAAADSEQAQSRTGFAETRRHSSAASEPTRLARQG